VTPCEQARYDLRPIMSSRILAALLALAAVSASARVVFRALLFDGPQAEKR
jgi:hypothetical protein